ncbi:16S rRNA (cytosine(1402)-N(4))-methyltransferase RsmH [Persicirhabdus sediminis]|uniref:Ribosomal RNA small subunit methyltransferase H n=1 Tax=Persicirhabdus sediminis TaxID=454144 RepID=A0A8J7MAB2_9BACT|nr:16S rRNA (cytosine(1402)-N(4))-methyltransferase RsmH [Persicirhabdus sediminis]MBK1789797.1 16S rRNA (cytosine(1402)-N(4))-methyltransferase RsmH [Persicirhabdus sediminis]
MEGASDYHVPVLFKETIHFMAPAVGKICVDGTLGGGGHSSALLAGGARVIGIDQDAQARAYASKRLASYGDQFTAVAGNFAEMADLLAEQGIEKVDSILVDIGVSSEQLNYAERGFSFMNDGPLDMRMNADAGETAADICNTWGEEDLANVIYKYGEEKASRRIARAIVSRRAEQPFSRTSELADCIASVLPRGGKKHPATRTFQALRIAVNDELGVLERLLHAASDLLKPGGRLVVITFHSLEDRMVKQFMRHVSMPTVDKKEWPEPRPNPDYAFKQITRKPVAPSDEECKSNPRARSSKLRVIEKI